MSIQIPNPGTGNGATGDNEFVLWSKVKDNFSDQTNAASRIVGDSSGNLAEFTTSGIGGSGIGGTGATPSIGTDLTKFAGRTGVYRGFQTEGSWNTSWNVYFIIRDNASSNNPDSTSERYTSILGIQRGTNTLYIGGHNADGTLRAWSRVWHSTNTKLDTNGALSPSSPTIDLYSDRIETNADGARMNPEFVRNGVGDYTIKNTTGLRVNDGWYIKIPNDMNGNPKVAIAIDTDKDGNLSIKTYRRIFSMETFTFIPDLETPLDIPEGRWIDLRFNEIPVEAQEELPTDGG